MILGSIFRKVLVTENSLETFWIYYARYSKWNSYIRSSL